MIGQLAKAKEGIRMIWNGQKPLSYSMNSDSNSFFHGSE